jgi:hypothetical protein
MKRRNFLSSLPLAGLLPFIGGCKANNADTPKVKVDIPEISNDDWIYCKDELPDNKEECFIVVKHNTENVDLPYVRKGRYENMHWRSSSWGSFPDGSVICWQPIKFPELPEHLSVKIESPVKEIEEDDSAQPFRVVDGFYVDENGFKLWGTYGKSGKEHFRWKRLVDCDIDHLQAILDTQHQLTELQRAHIKAAIYVKKYHS